ncbi:serine hydrolase domain-containing protein [Labrys monachus]|nr:serine hydrolase domain-containing protein [Labrys monachus]
MVTKDGARGVTVLVFRHGHLLYRVDAGDIARDARLPVASASKWLTAALVMSVVDDGLLSLDEPIGRRLPAFTGAAAGITLRQILSFTSGQGSLAGLVDLRQDPGLSLAESARAIARRPLEDKPGAVFRYGSPALQVAGALVEQATGKSWARLFEERLGRPLGLAHTTWGSPLWPDMPPADIHNPNLQGGLVTTAEDYGRFLTMLDAGGRHAGRRILSAASVARMESVQTRGARIAFVPAGATAAGLQYGLGNWCEVVEAGSRCSVVSSPGAFGTYPWIDRRHDLYGLFFMQRRLPLVEKDIRAARRIIVRAASGGPSR